MQTARGQPIDPTQLIVPATKHGCGIMADDALYYIERAIDTSQQILMSALAHLYALDLYWIEFQILLDEILNVNILYSHHNARDIVSESMKWRPAPAPAPRKQARREDCRIISWAPCFTDPKRGVVPFIFMMQDKCVFRSLLNESHMLRSLWSPQRGEANE